MKELFALLLGMLPTVHASPSRVLEIDENQLPEVRTALGHSTLLQFPGRPKSVVLGDQDAFRVEYVGNALSVKPLLPRSTTNLFVFSEYGSFNFRLVTTGQAGADNRILVRRKALVPPSSSEEIGTTMSVNGVAQGKRLEIRKVTLTLPPSQRAVVIRYTLALRTGSGSRVPVPARNVRLFQAGREISIQERFHPRVDLTTERPETRGTLVVRTSKLDRASPLTLTVIADESHAPLAKFALPVARLFARGPAHGASKENP